jgi:hypothetical protein
LFIDECLSPDYAIWLSEGGHDAIHPLHVGRRGQLDHTVLATCIAEDRAIVTENVGDFKLLLGREEIHPGLIALPHGGKDEVWALLETAIAFLGCKGGDPMDHLVNACFEFINGQAVLVPLRRPWRCGTRRMTELRDWTVRDRKGTHFTLPSSMRVIGLVRFGTFRRTQRWIEVARGPDLISVTRAGLAASGLPARPWSLAAGRGRA